MEASIPKEEPEMEASTPEEEEEELPFLSFDKLENAQRQCYDFASNQKWDRIKGHLEKHGPEVLLGIFNFTYNGQRRHYSVLLRAAMERHVETVKLCLDAGFDDKEAMKLSASESIANHGDDTTILRMLLEYGLDPNMDAKLEDFCKDGKTKLTLLMETAVVGCHINHAITLLDHGANVNKTLLDPGGAAVGALAYSIHHGRHDILKLFLDRGAIPTTDDVDLVYNNCLAACAGKHFQNIDGDLARAMTATFLHLGKPDYDVVDDAHSRLSAIHHDPVIAHITKQYIKGRPFCCEVCEALTAKGRDKLLMCPCRTIAYCSRDCQVKNWKKHKDECQGALNEKGESEALVKERKITGKGGKKGKKGKRGKK